jgi:hypothetical protein
MFGVRHQPPLPALDVGQLPLAFAAFAAAFPIGLRRLFPSVGMINDIQRYFFKMETFTEI